MGEFLFLFYVKMYFSWSFGIHAIYTFALVLWNQNGVSQYIDRNFGKILRIQCVIVISCVLARRQRARRMAGKQVTPQHQRPQPLLTVRSVLLQQDMIRHTRPPQPHKVSKSVVLLILMYLFITCLHSKYLFSVICNMCFLYVIVFWSVKSILPRHGFLVVVIMRVLALIVYLLVLIGTFYITVYTFAELIIVSYTVLWSNDFQHTKPFI